jgi:hypothetical protein
VRYRIWVSLGSFFLCCASIACGGTQEQRRVAQERTLRAELDGLVLAFECPRTEPEKSEFADEQAERARLELLRFRVDPRAPYRSARAAAFALTCTPAQSSELSARRQLSTKRWEAFISQGRLLIHRKSLAERSGDKAAHARALFSLAEFVDEASPKLAGHLRAQARRLGVVS